MVELSGGYPRRLLNFTRVGKTLPRERIATEETPPALRARLSRAGLLLE